MPTGKFKSRTFRRIFVKTPGGETKLSYRRRKPGKAQCAMCGDYLKGVASDITVKVRKLSKTQRRPERPYGGKLCSKCMRKVMVDKARALVMKNG